MQKIKCTYFREQLAGGRNQKLKVNIATYYQKSQMMGVCEIRAMLNCVLSSDVFDLILNLQDTLKSKEAAQKKQLTRQGSLLLLLCDYFYLKK